MASSGKRKTTFAKLSREGKLRERRAAKQAKKDAKPAGGGVEFGPPNPSGLPDPEPAPDAAVAADA